MNVMSIEVKQLVVKSSVLQRRETDAGGGSDETQKKEILEECKRLIQETLQEMKER